MAMKLYRFLLRLAQAFGIVSLLAGVAGLVYWYGTGMQSVFVVAGSGLLFVSGVAAGSSSLVIESAENEIRRLRREQERLAQERDRLASECDASRTRLRRLERRAESLSVVREIHRSTNIITRSERLRQILTLIGQLAENVEATLFAVRERAPGDTGPNGRLRPVAYHASCDADEIFIRFDRAFAPEAAVRVTDAVATTNGSKREISGDLVAEGEPVGRIEAVMYSGDAFGVAAEAAPEDVLAWIIGGVDLDSAKASAALDRGQVIRSRDVSSADIEFLYPLSAEGEMVGAFQMRVPERELGEAGSGIAAGGLGELDEVLSECSRHVALALKKEADADRAITDGLTGLLLKREFEPRLEEALGESLSRREPLALLVVDIDHFKKVNDTYGHRTGDLVLRGAAGLVRRHIRARDSAYRYGGEEICLVLPGTGAREAKAIAERLRESVEAARFMSEVGREVSVTISIGLTAVDPRRRSSKASGGAGHIADPAEFFCRADTAVYRAKRTGRNKVVVWTRRMKMRPTGVLGKHSVASSAAEPRDGPAASSGQRRGRGRAGKSAKKRRKTGNLGKPVPLPTASQHTRSTSRTPADGDRTTRMRRSA